VKEGIEEEEEEEEEEEIGITKRGVARFFSRFGICERRRGKGKVNVGIASAAEIIMSEPGVLRKSIGGELLLEPYRFCREQSLFSVYTGYR
jgi:hypothetical protein